MFEVVVEATIIIAADPVGVMTAQTLLIIWRGQEFMRKQFAVLIFKMAGTAAGTMAHLRIFISFIIYMTTQTAPAQEVVSQFQWR